MLAGLELDCVLPIVGVEEAFGNTCHVLRLPKVLFPLKHHRFMGSATDILGRFARAFGELHQHGIAYRNIQPSVLALGEDDRPALYDFYCAGYLDDSGQVGSIAKVRRYVTAFDAPEWRSERYDGVRADIFSLGATFRKLIGPDEPNELINRMTAASPHDRPASMASVAREAESQTGR